MYSDITAFPYIFTHIKPIDPPLDNPALHTQSMFSLLQLMVWCHGCCAIIFTCVDIQIANNYYSTSQTWVNNCHENFSLFLFVLWQNSIWCNVTQKSSEINKRANHLTLQGGGWIFCELVFTESFIIMLEQKKIVYAMIITSDIFNIKLTPKTSCHLQQDFFVASTEFFGKIYYPPNCWGNK